jgi:O-antigen ligase
VIQPLVEALTRLVEAPSAADRPTRRHVWGFWLYAVHLLTVVAIAASNALLGLAALLAPWPGGRNWLRRGRPLLLAILAYLLCLGASIAASHAPATSLRSASDAFNFLVPVVALVLVRTERQVRLLIKALILVGVLVAVHALLQYTFGADSLEARPVGPFSHYMTLAGFLVLVDCLLLAWMVFGSGWRRPWSWLALVLIQLALIASFTRNAWVALAVVLTLVAAVRAPRLLIAWLPALVLLIVFAPLRTVARAGSIADLEDPSNYDRLCMLYAGAGMLRDQPLLGQGPRMVRERYPIYRHPTAPNKWVPHLHNSFLNLAAERGLVSLIAMLALLWIPARKTLREFSGRGGRTGPTADIYFGVLLVLLATVITGMFEDYWRDTEIQRLVLFAVAMPYCLDQPRRRRPTR